MLNGINDNNKSSVDLSIIKMEKGQKYETIITTTNKSSNGTTEINSASIGVICSGKDTILCKIFKGSHTLKNIIKNKRFIINITENPMLFTLATLKKLDSDEYTELSIPHINGINYIDMKLKKADAYLIATVKDIKYGFDNTGTIDDDDDDDKDNSNYDAGIIKAEIESIIIEKEGARSFNRANSYVIESLVNYTRFDIVDNNTKTEYIKRLKEAKRVINRVGGKEHKLAINKIEKEIAKK